MSSTRHRVRLLFVLAFGLSACALPEAPDEPNARAIAELENPGRRMASLEAGVDALGAANVANLQDRESLRGDVGRLDERAEALGASVSRNHQSFRSVQGDVDELNARLAALDDRTGALPDVDVALRESVAHVEASLDDLEKALEDSFVRETVEPVSKKDPCCDADPYAFWNAVLEWLKAVGAVVVFVFGIIRFFGDRDRAREEQSAEDRRRHFEWMMEQWDAHLTDASLVPIIQSIEEGALFNSVDPDIRDDRMILTVRPGELNPKEYERRNLFDRYFERLERLVCKRSTNPV